MTEFFNNQHGLMLWLGLISAFMFLASLVIVPYIITRMPADYLLHKHTKPFYLVRLPLVLKIPLLLLKNLLGLLLIIVGLALLVLPGQGILTMLMGLVLLDFPKKRALLVWLVSRPAVIATINWMRKKRNQPALKLPD